MKRKRPKVLPVGAVPFDIVWPTTASLPDEDKGDHGETIVADRRISITRDKAVNLIDEERTLLHEATHAALGLAGIDNLLDDKLEEAIVTAIENNLYFTILELVRLGYFRGHKPT